MNTCIRTKQIPNKSSGMQNAADFVAHCVRVHNPFV